MAPTVEVIIGVLAFVLALVSVVGMVLGCEAYLGGERLERCPDCGRFGLTVGRRRHPGGCPSDRGAHLKHWWSWVFHGRHVAHH